MKYLPIGVATAVIVAFQIGCTYVLMTRSQPVDEIFVDHVQQIVYDGEVVRADVGRAWVSGAEARSVGDTETRTVARLVLTREATVTLHKQLAELLAVVRRPPVRAEPDAAL
jgi:hypothetical protein